MKKEIPTMRKLTTLLALFLCLLPATAKKDGFNGLTAMSFNIRTANAKDGTNSWEFRADAVLEMIKDQKPDVIGMQEALLRQVQPLDYFLDDYKWVGVGREDGKKDGEIMAIKHRDYDIYGLQFHPESILTPEGKTILKNFIKIAERRTAK